MKWSKKLISILSFTGIGILSAATIGAVVSCSSNSSAPSDTNKNPTSNENDVVVANLVKQTNQQFEDSIFNGSKYFQYTSADKNKILTVLNNNLTQAQNYANDQAFTAKLSVDGQIWLDALIDQIKVNQQLIESNIHLLLINQWFQLSFTNYSHDLSDNISNSIFNPTSWYYLIGQDNNETTTNFNQFDTYLTQIKTNLSEGLSSHTTLSKVMIKHAIGNLLQNTFSDLLDAIVNYAIDNNLIDSAISINQDLLINLNPSFQQIFNPSKTTNDSTSSTKTYLPNNYLIQTLTQDLGDQANLFTTQLNNIQSKLLSLLVYLCNDYYTNINYGGTGNFIIKVVTTPTNEEDNGYKIEVNNQAYYVSGLGLDNNDLNTKDIGIGFMTNPDGQKIYQALLRKHSNTKQTPLAIYQLGNNAVNEIKANMEQVARVVAEIYVGKNQAWSPSFYYDPDSSGNEFGSQLIQDLPIVDQAGNVNLINFFKWLNGNQWFNGRDMVIGVQTPTIDGVQFSAATDGTTFSGNVNYEYKTTFTSTHNLTNVNIGDVIGDYKTFGNPTTNGFNGWSGTDVKPLVDGDAGNLAYKYLVQGLSPSTIETSNTITNKTQTNSISPEAAFVGSSHAVYQYLLYKDYAAPVVNKIFEPTSIDYTLRTGVGGAAYANGGDGSWSYSNSGYGGFYLDSNPYFGLQKWSMSTLSNHEGVPGHVYQFNYAHDHPTADYAPSFDSTAYAEGWGLFAEWLAVQVGLYGAPVEATMDNSLAIPEFGKNSNNVKVNQFKNQYEYANGAYWVNGDDPSTTEVENGYNSQRLYDALQYFGFLNERQLRAMRCAVDVGIHAGVNGDYSKNSGYSLNEARTYLKNNSGLGLDDINRESKRYLEYTGQAVSYFNGTIAIQNLYLTAKDAYESANPGSLFVDYQNLNNQNTASFFDIILRNGDIPINVLTKHVDEWISQQDWKK